MQTFAIIYHLVYYFISDKYYLNSPNRAFSPDFLKNSAGIKYFQIRKIFS